jgi:4'-phosphopantetheinyl transferase
MRTLIAAEFVAVDSVPALASEEIHLWFFPGEVRPRGARMDVVRAQRAIAQDRLLRLLGGYLGRPATEVVLGKGEHGKPKLACATDLQFNISHSGPALLIGVTAGTSLGVDLESFGRERPIADLARRFFASGEATALAGLPLEDQQEAFLRLWTCKEAVLKALGLGLSFGLDRLEFFLQAAYPTHLQAIAGDAGPAKQWQIAAIQPWPEMLGAVAWKGLPKRLRCFSKGPLATR